MNELIGKRISVLDKGWVELQDVMGDDLAIVNAARTSYLGESKGSDKDKKLLFYLMQHRHDGPFEMATVKYRIKAPEVVWRQLLRHRSGCIAGDTEITFNRPNHWRTGHHRKQSGNKGAKLTIERLYHLWADPVYRPRIKTMLLRVYDEQAATFTVSCIQDVIHSGKKEVFEIETKSGKKLQATRDHRLLTEKGWQRLEDAIGLEVSSNGTAVITKSCAVLTNGTEKLWRSYDWMKKQCEAGKSVADMAKIANCSCWTIRSWLRIHQLPFPVNERPNEELWHSYDWMKKQCEAGKSVEDIAKIANCACCTIHRWLRIHQLPFPVSERPNGGFWNSYGWMKQQREAGKSVIEIAEMAGCSYHTIRKWLRIHQLQFSLSERRLGKEPWNKAKKGYRQPPRTPEHLAKLRTKARRGEQSHFWRGGMTSEREKIGAWTTSIAPQVHRKYNYICQICGEAKGKLHAHHIKPVAQYPELAYDFDNLMTVCKECHQKLHEQENRERGKKNIGTPLVAVYEKIVKVTRIGVIDTYDLCVQAPNHNFVANGLVVHNSFNLQSYRYLEVEEEEFYTPTIWRQQARNNKQASEGELDTDNAAALTEQLREHYMQGYQLYKQALELGVAREQARLFLPGFALYSVGIVQFDLRNLLHFLSLRKASDAQYEIRQFADALGTFVEELFPWTWEAYVTLRLESY